MGSQDEDEASGSGSIRRTKRRRRRLFAAYAALAALVIFTVAAILVFFARSESTNHGNPHINLESGSTNGILPDDRAGIPSPKLSARNLREAALTAGCELRLRLPVEGRDHIPSTAPEPKYRTNPATSGDHVEEQQADGAYRESPAPVSIVHSLEHGRLTIQYKPILPEPAQLELIGLFDTMYGGTLLFPNPKMPYVVAATTWTNLLGCHSYRGLSTLAAIRAFGQSTWGRYGGEPLVGITPNSPTPTSLTRND